MTHTALIIDDEADIRALIAMSLDRIGLDTHTASNLREAKNLLNTYRFDVCLTDMKLPDGNGVDFVKHIHSVQPELPVAVITAHGNMDAAVEAMKNGAFDFVSKPVDLGLLRKLVLQAINISERSGTSETPSFTKENQSILKEASKRDKPEKHEGEDSANSRTRNTESVPNHTHTYIGKSAHKGELIGRDRLIGHSEPMKALKKMITKVAQTNAPVWITGESGTGKELIAQLIHENSPRSSAPFVAINCGAIPSELMESEMFGHRKGSFTGAHSDHDGLFKRAEGGTLFLDEVAELPLHMQVKLLRAIQERRVRPVGCSDEISTDVRILSASHKDLANEVEAGSFRHDLYYRLNVISIRSPSLRDRSDDICVIARHVLKSIARNEGSERQALLTPEAENRLSQYLFPGNVRELENILERAVALNESDTIDSDDLNLPIVNAPATNNALKANDVVAANDMDEREKIIHALGQTRWNRKATAELLGMTYRQLRYRIKQYGIDDDKQTGTGT